MPSIRDEFGRILDLRWSLAISARVSRFVRSASGRTAEKRRNLARSKMRGFLRLAAPLSHARTQLRRAAVDAGKADGPRTSASQDRQSREFNSREQGIGSAEQGNRSTRPRLSKCMKIIFVV